MARSCPGFDKNSSMSSLTLAKPVRALSDCADLFEQRLVEHIQEQGYQTLHQAGSCYTVGLWLSLGHPELILFGLPERRAHRLLRVAVERIAAGERWAVGQLVEGLAEGYPLRLQSVHPDHYREYLSYNRWFYRGAGFEAAQLVWPDPDKNFPDHPDFLSHYQKVQPCLQLPLPCQATMRG